MKKPLHSIYVLCCIVLLTHGQVLAQVSFVDFDKAERIVNRIIRKKKVPGLAITVSKNKQTVWSKGFGYATIENQIPVNPDSTVFRIGSISKPIAAMALFHTTQEGLIALDSSVYQYVPYFPRKKYDISIKQLGGHVSGIRNYRGNEFRNKKPLSIKDGLAFFQKDTLLFQPGTDYAYSSYNWNLISLAIQERANLPFGEYVNATILAPFQMNSTFPDKNQELARKATFYRRVGRRRFKPEHQVENYFKLASGGYLSTTRDLNTFGNALLNHTLVDNNQFKTFITAQTINNTLSQSTYYGIGFEVSYDVGDRFYFGHKGNALGGYGIFYVYPEEHVVISILTNCSNPKIDRLFDKVINAVFQSLQTN